MLFHHYYVHLFIDLECGFPAQIPNGHYTLLNGTRGYQSMVRYSCDEGHVMVGRSDLMCDIDQKWNGPPPRCEAFSCPDPPALVNGGFKIIEQSASSLVVEYECDPRFTLQGPKRLTCSEGSYDQVPPTCKSKAAAPVPPVGGIPSKSKTTAGTTTKKSVETTTARISVTTPQYTSSSTVKYPDAVNEESEDPSLHYPEYEEETDGNHNGLGAGDRHEEDSGDEVHDRDHEDHTLPTTVDGDIEPKKQPPGIGVRPDFVDNDVSESNKILQRTPGVETPKSSIKIEHKDSAVARLNLGKAYHL
jgi:hypothetical protein